MTGTVILSDHGQSYVEFDIVDDLIKKVRPRGRAGWRNVRVMNRAWLTGGRLIVELRNGYRFALRYPIVEIHQASDQ